MASSRHIIHKHLEKCLYKMTKIQYHIQLLKSHGERSSVLETEYESTLAAKRVFERHLMSSRVDFYNKKDK